MIFDLFVRATLMHSRLLSCTREILLCYMLVMVLCDICVLSTIFYAYLTYVTRLVHFQSNSMTNEYLLFHISCLHVVDSVCMNML